MAINQYRPRVHLINVKLYREDDNWFLWLAYHVDTETEMYELIIPKLYLPFNNELPSIGSNGIWDTTTDVGFGEVALYPDRDGNVFIHKTLEKKVREITIEEIEQLIGAPVKIVKEKK